MMNKIYYSTKEVAERYGLSTGTLRFWRCMNKELPPQCWRGPLPTQIGNSIRYHIEDLLRWEKSTPTIVEAKKTR